MGLLNSFVNLFCHITWIVILVLVFENSLLTKVKCAEIGDQSDHSRIKRKAVPQDSQRWPEGIIPYVITEPLASDFVSKEAIMESLHTMQRDTCITFVDATRQDAYLNTKYVRFIQANGCHSSVGKTDSAGPQVVSIGKSCRYPQMVLHELGHLVGLVHEHCRPDRDAHIMVNWNNIRPDMAYNFDKVQDVRILTPYDLSSFMHYGLKVFSDNKMYNSIMPINSDLSFLVGYRPDLSFYDKVTINTLYQCAAHCPYRDVCDNEGFLDKDCKCVCPRLLTGNRCQKVITDRDCGERSPLYVTNQTIVTTPNYPNHYSNRQSCVWYFQSAENQVMEVEFEDFDLESGRFGVCRDQLEIRAHYIGLDRGRAYCGEHLNETIISTTNKLILNFQSSMSETRRGFKAIIRTRQRIDCSSSPCQNGGLCQPMENYPDYYCSCQDHWIGKNCDIPVLNGVFSEWGDWSNCTAACGLQCRHRKCDSPAPQNGGTDCTGHTLETRRCQPEHINCAEQFICDFEEGHMCYGMWITGDKDMAWRANIGSTPSMHTGPSQGHLGPADGYLFMESSHGDTNEETTLWLPSSQWHLGIYCIQFYYHLYGKTIGTLKVLRRTPNDITPQILWQRSNNHGNKWIEVNLNTLLYEDVEIGFVGVRGTGYYSDIAIDDISASPGTCKLPRDTYAKGCKLDDQFHNVGPVSYVKDCKKRKCFCNPDGEVDCPDWDWEDVCNKVKVPVKKPTKKYRYKPASLNRRNNNKADKSDAGGSGSVKVGIIRIRPAGSSHVNKKQSRRRRIRPRKFIRLGSSKPRNSVRLIGSGEED